MKPPTEFSLHALQRFRERWEPHLSISHAAVYLEVMLIKAVFVSIEDNNKSTWRIGHEPIYLTVEDGEVKTVHPRGSKPKERRRCAE